MATEFKLVPVEQIEDLKCAVEASADYIGTMCAGFPRATEMLDALDACLKKEHETPKSDAEPVFWYRQRSDGGYEGPIHNSSIGDVRKNSGAWSPLYAAQPPAVAVQGDEVAILRAQLHHIRKAVDGVRALKKDTHTKEGSSFSEQYAAWGELNAALESSHPEQPAPVPTDWQYCPECGHDLTLSLFAGQAPVPTSERLLTGNRVPAGWDIRPDPHAPGAIRVSSPGDHHCIIDHIDRASDNFPVNMFYKLCAELIGSPHSPEAGT